MSRDDRDIDGLLRQNLKRQLEGFDWDGQRQAVTHRLAAPRVQRSHWVVAIRVAAGAAALLALAVGYLGLSSLQGTRPYAPAPRQAMALHASTGADALLASTDATTILLTGSARWLVLNDPLLAPHSLWDQ
jgi:hypothetical protein